MSPSPSPHEAFIFLSETVYELVSPTAEQYILSDTLVMVEPAGIDEKLKRSAPRRSVLAPLMPTRPAKKYCAVPQL